MSGGRASYLTNSGPRRLAPAVVAALIAAAGLAAYCNSFGGAFLFDDIPTIVENPQLAAWPQVWGPAENTTVSGRPLLNLTLALNYAAGGLAPWGYHVVNLAIHVLAATMLAGVIRRTLRQPRLVARWGAWADEIALAAAVAWLVHPLQTESVTYIVQRAESLGGLAYLGVLYGFVRASAPDAHRGWWGVMLGAALLGVATKETIVTVPVMVWLYDVIFVAGNVRSAWAARGRWHLALAATWLPLAWLVAGTGERGGSAGWNTEISSVEYLLTQAWALPHYLQLVWWARPLVLDYGTPVMRSVGEVWWQAGVVLALVVVTAWALRRRPAVGWLGLLFFALLAPSSSVVPVATQTVAEHRMYLALAVPVLAGVLGLFAILGRRAWWVVAAVLLGWTGLTLARNRDYDSPLAMWTQNVASRPDNPRAHYNLSLAMQAAGRAAEAETHLEMALRLQPAYPEANLNLGNVRLAQGRRAEARAFYEAAVRAWPDFAEAWVSFGYWWLGEGELAQAAACYQRALALRTGYAEAHNNLGELFARQGQLDGAVTEFAAALSAKPSYAEAHNNLAGARLQQGRVDEAVAHLEQALALKPDLVDALGNLGYVRLEQGRYAEAERHYRALVQVAPRDVGAHSNLGYLQWKQGRLGEALREYEVVLQLDPTHAGAREAVRQLRAAGAR